MPDESDLSSAQSIGSAVVEVGADVSAAEAKLNAVKRLLAEVGSKPVTVKIAADGGAITKLVADLRSQAANKPLRFPVNFDSSRAADELLAAVKAKFAATTIQVRFTAAGGPAGGAGVGSGGVVVQAAPGAATHSVASVPAGAGGGSMVGPRLADGTFRSTTARDRRAARSADDVRVSIPATDHAWFDTAVDRDVAGGSGRLEAARRAAASHRRDTRAFAAESREAMRNRVRNYGVEHGPRLEDGAFVSITDEDRRGIRAMANAGPDDDGGNGAGRSRVGPGGVRSPGRSGGGRGGNPFTVRGAGRILGNVAATYAAAEGLAAGGQVFASYAQEGNNQREMLAGMDRPGSLHVASQDAYLRDQAGQLAHLQAVQSRADAVTSRIPVLGTLFNDVTGASAANARRQAEVKRKIDLHESAVGNVDSQTIELAGLTANVGDVARSQAAQTLKAAQNDYTRPGGDKDPAVEQQLRNAEALSRAGNELGGRLDVARSSGHDLTSMALTLGGEAAGAARYGDRPGLIGLQGQIGIADAARGYGTQEAGIANADERAKVHEENQRDLANRQTVLGVNVDEAVRTQTGADAMLRAEPAAAQAAGRSAAAAGRQNSLEAFDEGRAGRRATGEASAFARLAVARGTRDEFGVRQAVEAEFGKYTPGADGRQGTFAGGGSADAGEDAQRIQLARQQAVELQQLAAQSNAAQLSAQHQYADATMAILKAEGEAKVKLADQSQKAAVAAANRAAEAGLQVQQNEHRTDVTTGADAAEAASGQRVNRDFNAAARTEYDAETERQLRHADAKDRADVSRQRQAGFNALAAGQDFAVDQGRQDLAAARESAEQFTAGQTGRASATGRIRSIVAGVQNAPPELRGDAVAAADAELRAERHKMTGYHGGALVQGNQDAGAARAEIAEGRLQAQRDGPIARDLDTARVRIRQNPARVVDPQAAAAHAKALLDHANAANAKDANPAIGAINATVQVIAKQLVAFLHQNPQVAS